MKKFIFVLVLLFTTIVLVSCGKDVTEVESIKMLTQPKSVYVLNESIEDLDVEVVVSGVTSTYSISYTVAGGVKVKVKGATSFLDLEGSGFTITGFATNSVGQKTAVIKFEKDGSSAQVTFNYEVVDQIETPLFAGGTGTQNDPFLIANKTHMQNITKMFETSDTFHYYKIANGVTTIDASNWESIFLWGSFDGNSVKFTNLDNALFRALSDPDYTVPQGNVVIQNFNIENAKIISSGSAAPIVRTIGVQNITFKNINVSGYIEGSVHVSSLALYGPGNYTNAEVGWVALLNMTVENFVSTATVVATGGVGVGYIAHAMATPASVITIKDSIFKGQTTTTDLKNSKYVVGNWYNGTITFEYASNYLADHQIANATSLYDETKNGVQFVLEGKRSVLTTTEGDLPANVGDVFSVAAVADAVKATFSLVVAPNGPDEKGNFVGTYLSETISTKTGDNFASQNVKRFTVRINHQGVTETGASEDFFNIVGTAFGTTIGANTTVRVVQYDANGNILQITNFSFGDK